MSDSQVHNEWMKARAGARNKRPAVSAEDRDLFLSAVADAKPIAARDRVAPPIAPPAPRPRAPEVPTERPLAVEADGGRYAARGPGVSHAQVAELRAGRVRAEATLDLHGSKVDRGLVELRAFLVEADRLGRRCVLVVHGKGLHSEVGAPLREAVLAELLGPLSGLVHAFASAANPDGGEGATYVALRGKR